MPNDSLLNVEQVRVLLGGESKPVSKMWAYKLIKEGKLKAIRYGTVKGIRVYRSSVERYLRDRGRDMSS
ncbi:MAG: helix-turn-helix domain-containing protein [Desulfovibrio sp.]|uniref:Phage transcriptional regulator, AlpA n=1 Tax=Solidesulfovibrio fructosivorans JJ] TaxID=596151 RepID=E1JR87_SOLFR|nr:helix-turn-helix domain-containing protein [Solidesulfovibrio fructosivorans]EFL53088.1 phage transcriptional regulator, AlpA [Solidesulfovibrio fructosivorans JJ]]